MVKLPSQERIDEIAAEFREVLAPRSPAMTTAEQSHLEDYEGFIAIAQSAHALRLLVVEFLRRRYAKLAEAVPEVEVDEWIGKLAAAVSITCCDHAAEFHDQRGCSECPCGSRWSEHPHRDRDPMTPAKIAFVMNTAYSEVNDDPWPDGGDPIGGAMWMTNADAGGLAQLEIAPTAAISSFSNTSDAPIWPTWATGLDASERTWLRERLDAGEPMPSSHSDLRMMMVNATGGPGGLR